MPSRTGPSRRIGGISGTGGGPEGGKGGGMELLMTPGCCGFRKANPANDGDKNKLGTRSARWTAK